MDAFLPLFQPPLCPCEPILPLPETRAHLLSPTPATVMPLGPTSATVAVLPAAGPRKGPPGVRLRVRDAVRRNVNSSQL